ncbi:MAG: 3-dehydroquinate synthase [Verrucomicrobiales bacterium]
MSNPTPANLADLTCVPVPLTGHAYNVYFGANILAQLPEALNALFPERRYSKILIVSDQNVATHYLADLEKAFAGGPVVTLTCPAGESSKSFDTLALLCSAMAGHRLDRKSLVIALGGGVIGDLAGLAAAIYMRGLEYVQVPTTIVSQVDSAVGGKTGINLPAGKNLIGAFHHPCLVWADVMTLATLPERAYFEGWAEVIKHGCIRDRSMLDQLITLEQKPGPQLIPTLARNVEIKAQIVAADEKETTGLRALLNFGHTVGHALEQLAGYGKLLHGEAVSLGMVVALAISQRRGAISKAEQALVLKLLERWRLPTRLEVPLDLSALSNIMALDKKFESGAIRYVLLGALGDGELVDDVTWSELQEVIDSQLG